MTVIATVLFFFLFLKHSLRNQSYHTFSFLQPAEEALLYRFFCRWGNGISEKFSNSHSWSMVGLELKAGGVSSLSLPAASPPSPLLPPKAKSGLTLWALKHKVFLEARYLFLSKGSGENTGKRRLRFRPWLYSFFLGQAGLLTFISYFRLRQLLGHINKGNATKSVLPCRWREPGGDAGQLQWQHKSWLFTQSVSERDNAGKQIGVGSGSWGGDRGT